MMHAHHVIMFVTFSSAVHVHDMSCSTYRGGLDCMRRGGHASFEKMILSVRSLDINIALIWVTR